MFRSRNDQVRKLPGGGTAVTALHTAQQTEVAPAGYNSRFLQPEHTNWLCPPVHSSQFNY